MSKITILITHRHTAVAMTEQNGCPTTANKFNKDLQKVNTIPPLTLFPFNILSPTFITIKNDRDIKRVC